MRDAAKAQWRRVGPEARQATSSHITRALWFTPIRPAGPAYVSNFHWAPVVSFKEIVHTPRSHLAPVWQEAMTPTLSWAKMIQPRGILSLMHGFLLVFVKPHCLMQSNIKQEEMRTKDKVENWKPEVTEAGKCKGCCGAPTLKAAQISSKLRIGFPKCLDQFLGQGVMQLLPKSSPNNLSKQALS